MSKSTSMLPSLAGGSGVAAHALVDSDLMKVVDAVTLNADRDRKVTLAELKSFFSGSYADAEVTTPVTLAQAPGGPTTVVSVPLSAGNWEVSAILILTGATVSSPVSVYIGGPTGVTRIPQAQPVFTVPASSTMAAIIPPCTVTVVGTGVSVHVYGLPTTSSTITAQGYVHARRLP